MARTGPTDPSRAPARGGRHYGPPGRQDSSSPGRQLRSASQPAPSNSGKSIRPPQSGCTPPSRAIRVPFLCPDLACAARAGRVTLIAILAGRGWLQHFIFSCSPKLAAKFASTSFGSLSHRLLQRQIPKRLHLCCHGTAPACQCLNFEPLPSASPAWHPFTHPVFSLLSPRPARAGPRRPTPTHRPWRSRARLAPPAAAHRPRLISLAPTPRAATTPPRFSPAHPPAQPGRARVAATGSGSPRSSAPWQQPAHIALGPSLRHRRQLALARRVVVEAHQDP